MSTTSRLVVIESVNCGACGITFGLDTDFKSKRLEDGKLFYCPNGDRVGWSDTEVKQLRRSLEQAQRAAIVAREARDFERQRREEAERSAAAHKGVATRMRRRAINGVCVLGCKRTFADIRRHNESKHPGVVAE